MLKYLDRTRKLLMCFWSYFRQTSGKKATDNKQAQREKFSKELSALCLGMESSLLDGTFIDIGSLDPFFIALLSFSSNIFFCVYFIYI